MKLFKRSPFRSLRGGVARSDQAPEEDKSIGSNLSEADRFDILIPLRSNRVLPLFGRDEGSEISSITTDDRHNRTGSRKRTKKSPRGVMTTCCYGSDTKKASESVVATTVKGGASEATGTTPLVPLSTSSLFDWACCGPAPIEDKIKRVKSRRGKNASAASLVPTNSLFDSVMSDDEDRDPVEVITVSSTKRRGWKMPSKLRVPWRRSDSRRVTA
jgi:hypothetical protein